MVLVRVDDIAVLPWGYRLYVYSVKPRTWIAAEMVNHILDAQAAAKGLGWEPKVEIDFRDQAVSTLTIRAENGTWIWRFTGFDEQRDVYMLAWPD